MARARTNGKSKQATATKPIAALPPAPEPPDPDMETDDEDEDDDEEEEEQTAEQGTGEYIVSAEDAQRMKGFDEESRVRNMSLQASLDRKANGAKKIRFNARGMQKYDGAAHLYVNTQGDQCRVEIRQTRPSAADKEVISIMEVPTYADLMSRIQERHWKGDDAQFKWTIYIQGHMCMASDFINFEANVEQRLRWRKRNEELERAANLASPSTTTSAATPAPAPAPAPAAPAPAPAPQYPQQTYAQAPAAQYPQQPPYGQPPAGYVPQGYGPQPAPAQGYPSAAPPAYGAPAPSNPYAQGPSPNPSAEMIAIDYRPRPASFRMPSFEEFASTQGGFRAPEPSPAQVHSEPQEENEESEMGANEELQNALMERFNDLETQLQEMQERLAQSPAQEPAVALPQPVYPEIIEIHRPRPVYPPARRPAAVEPPAAPAAPAPAPAPAAPTAPALPPVDWAALMSQRAPAEAEMQRQFRMYIDGVTQKLESLKSTVIMDRKAEEQQNKLMQTLQNMQSRMNWMGDQMQSMQQTIVTQQQQLMNAREAAQAAARVPAPAPAAVPEPTPAPAPRVPSNGYPAGGYVAARPAAPAPQPGYAPNPSYQPAAGYDQPTDGQLGIFGQQPPHYPHAPVPAPTPAPATPKKSAMQELSEQLDETLNTVQMMQKMAAKFGMVPASQVQQPAPPPPPPRPEPEPEPEPEHESPSAISTAASMAAGVAGAVMNDDEPYKFKDLGNYRAVYTKEGKLADPLTQAVFNMDNLGNIIKAAKSQFDEARKRGEDEQKLQRMSRELEQMRRNEQTLQQQVQTLRVQAQQSSMMPPLDIDEYVGSAPPAPAPPPPAPAPAPAAPMSAAPPPMEDFVAVEVEPDPVASAPAPAAQGGSMLDSLAFADSLLD